MSAEATAVRVVVRGRVQGVWFREGCRRQAQAAGVSGWVRNRSDGAVEAELAGDPEAVQRLVEWCREGPPHARVDTVDVAEVEAADAQVQVEAAAFEVR